ncbi:MAG: bifunctional adenosylcobinamide kinase/adenosylcobinamide-phosphate guanylyltransferase [Desulfovibrionaceae bacterium]|nr:bifunctional adenosylcobinamide kinase/adenosylcobinamide-phosphate guanylyltransferase [Desulfovibrionaceae bacterium]
MITSHYPILFVGGTRSGKSSLAQSWAESLSSNPIFIATLQVMDFEMRERVKLHQEQRGQRFALVEEPLALNERLASFLSHEATTILIDCISTWVTNLLMANLTDQEIEAKVLKLAEIIKLAKFPLGLVTCETGLGVVPVSSLGRRFRDLLGTTNQILAKAVKTVVLVSCGLPLVLKGNFKVDA